MENIEYLLDKQRERIEYLLDRQRERGDRYFPKPTSWAIMRYDGRELPFQESRIPSNWWKTNYDPCENAYYILLPESDVPVLQALGAKRDEAYQDSEDPLCVELAAPSFAPPVELIEYLSNEWRTDDQSEK